MSLSPALCKLRSRLIESILPSTPVLFGTRFHATLVVPLKQNAPEPSEPQQEPLQLVFKAEPLGVPASEGYGYYQGRLGDTIGPGDRFKLEAKLGFGMASSVWLARDQSLNRLVALKILTGAYTSLNREGNLRELSVFQRLGSSTSRSQHCIRLFDHFYVPGVDPEDGEHLCLATELMNSNLTSIRKENSNLFIPIPIIKRILRHTLQGIAALHDCGVAHTDLKEDNIMIDLGNTWTTGSIDAWFKANPPCTYPPEQSLTKMVTAYVSQSLPLPSLEALSFRTFKVADFGYAQIVSDQTTDHITPLKMRPPEIILGGQWDESVDIWGFGCLVFHILTGKSLFKEITMEERSKEDMMLYQMVCFCGDFPESLLERCSWSLWYFDRSDCKLVHKGNKTYSRKSFQQCILDSGLALAQEDVEGSAGLMTKALRLEPRDRLKARELLQDAWLRSEDAV